LLAYRLGDDFRHDVIAGVCVASVAVPVAIAYAQLAGFRPEVGLYSSILPLVAYAIFGTSRQLIVNPDAAVCAMVAASVAPLAAGDPRLYATLSVVLTLLAGIFCILSSFFRLGAVADFLSKPILIGFMNGVAFSILLGQIGKICGFHIESTGIVRPLVEIISKLPQVHWPTLAIGLGSLIILLVVRRAAHNAPGALIVMVGAGAVIAMLKLDARGVAVLGPISGGFPTPHLPVFPPSLLPAIAAKAAGLALVIFSGGVLTARTFASKNHYEIDVDAELTALGAANIASALGMGFAVTDADSRTAVADASGGRTQMTGLVAAICMAIVLLCFAKPLKYVPIAALGAVLVFAAVSLLDFASLRQMWRVDKAEVAISLITMLAVVVVGPINGILVAVTLALARFIRRAARPRDEILGRVAGMPGYHSIERHPGAQTFPRIVIYRFGGPLTFFNSDYFRQRVLAVADAAGPDLRWFVLDAIPMTSIDVTGLDVLGNLRRTLRERGITLVVAGRKTEFLNWLGEIGMYHSEDDQVVFSTLHEAMRAFRASHNPQEPQLSSRGIHGSLID
jgi:high affinity sulfate transporter 1